MATHSKRRSRTRDMATLRTAFPKLDGFFDTVGEATYPPVDALPLLNAIVRVVNSQMLSTKAASAIFTRIKATAKQRRLKYLINLTPEEFRACGMSNSKVRTLQEFREKYRKDRARFERWRELPFDELEQEVDAIWGISTWTAEMLAMFYFGHTDVFPSKDLAINRGVEQIQRYLDPDFDPAQGAPCRTLLARCIWRSYDVDYWQQFD